MQVNCQLSESTGITTPETVHPQVSIRVAGGIPQAAESSALTVDSGAEPTFSSLGLSERLSSVLTHIGYERPSPIQVACIPHLMKGRDLLGMAQTGSGKTAAFALPALDRINPAVRSPQLLVLTPTRELAIQVAEACTTYSQKLPAIQTVALYGGQRYDIQLRALRQGPQVVVGTPGRLLDHIKQKNLDLSKLMMLVLDEADEMLRMGFIEDVENILSVLPSQHQTALFSATMPEAIRRITRRFMHSPEEVKIRTTAKTAPGIEQRYWYVQGESKGSALLKFLEIERFEAAIIFVRTKTATVEVAELLEKQGHNCAALNGDMTQSLREQTLDRLRAGRLNILIATDVAARGLDVDRLSLVVNYDIPLDTESYIHRIGRTGRAGRSGKALLFVGAREVRLLRNIERALRTTISQAKLPTHTELSASRFSQFTEQLKAELKLDVLAPYSTLLQQLQTELGCDVETLGTVLLKYAQKNRPLLLPPESAEVRHNRNRPVPEFDLSQPKAFSRAGGRSGPAVRAGFPQEGRREPEDMIPYRLGIGRLDGVDARHIVGALANEGQLRRSQIGNIKLADNHSMVELPKHLPQAVLTKLAGIRLFNKALGLQPSGEARVPAYGARTEGRKSSFRGRDRSN